MFFGNSTHFLLQRQALIGWFLLTAFVSICVTALVDCPALMTAQPFSRHIQRPFAPSPLHLLTDGARSYPKPRTTLPVNETCQRRLGPKGGLWRPALLQLGNFSTTHLGAWSAIQSKDRPPLQSSGPMTDRSQIMHAMQRSRSLSRLCFSPAMGLICTALPSARHPQRFDFAEGTDRAEPMPS
ncbi:hypothetical protein HDK77DRAFT_49192 [Phyllosticta capitalensis]